MTPTIIRKNKLALAVMAVTAATVAQAEETTTYQPTLLDQVTVSATRTEQTLDSVASSVSVTTAEDNEKNMVNNIRDMVKYEPGVGVSSDARFGLGSFNVRGMDGNRVKMTVDGVDQAEAFDSTRLFLRSQRNYVDVENMKQVEVLKGPASAMYGSDAIGGVVAFTTKDPSDYLKPEGDDSYASAKAGFASADSSYNETLTFANRNGDLESMLVYTRRDGKERETHGGADVKGDARGEADPLDYSANSLLGKLQYQLNENNRVGLTAEWQDNHSQSDLLSMYGYEVSGQEPYESFMADDKISRSRFTLFHELDAFTVAFDTLRWQLSWQESETNQASTDELDVDMGPNKDIQKRLNDYYYTETSWQFDLILNKDIQLGSHSHFLTYGFDFEKKDQENLNKTSFFEGQNPDNLPDETHRYAPLSTMQSWALFLQDEISLNDHLTVTPGIRYDAFSTDVDQEGYTSPQGPAEDREYESWTGKLGAVYALNDTLSVFGQYSQGFGVPDSFSMYFNENPIPMVEILPNPNLEPEKSDSFELGLRANGRLGSMELTAFYNQYEDYIEMVMLEANQPFGGVYQYQNLDEATIKGIEFRSQLRLDEALNAPAGTRLNTTIAWAEGRGTFTNQADELKKDEPLNSVAPLKAVIGLGYDAPTENWGGELVWTLVAEKDRDDISEGDRDSSESDPQGEQYATPGYGLVDLTGYYKPTKDITLRAGIFNMTDKKYWAWDDVRGVSDEYSGLDRYTQPGRNYSVSVKWEI